MIKLIPMLKLENLAQTRNYFSCKGMSRNPPCTKKIFSQSNFFPKQMFYAVLRGFLDYLNASDHFDPHLVKIQLFYAKLQVVKHKKLQIFEVWNSDFFSCKKYQFSKEIYFSFLTPDVNRADSQDSFELSHKFWG